MNFQKDNWNLYWTANQEFHSGESRNLRYTSGGKYTADFWNATFSESVQGETADYNFALSANFGNHLWKINPQFAIDSEYDRKKDEWKTENSFRISGEMRYDNWNFSANTDTERFRINAVHRF